MNKLIVSLILCISIISSSSVIFANENNSNKEEIYNQYKSVVEEIAEIYDADITFVSIENFDFENTVSIEEFRDVLMGIGESQKNHNISIPLIPNDEYDKMVEEINNAPKPRISKTKTDSVTLGTKICNVNITAECFTYYNATVNRQLFSSNSYISSISSSTSGLTWSTTAKNSSIIDGGRTLYVAAQGNVYYNGGTWTGLSVSAEFYCSSVGGIS